MKPFLAVALFVFTSVCHAQTINLLKNSKADENLEDWKVYNSATVEKENGNNFFVLRNKGYLTQEVALPEGTIDKFIVFLGRAASSQTNQDNSLASGLPYLYGYLTRDNDPRGGRINSYLSGSNMISQAKTENEWNYVWGIFQVPVGTKNVDYFLNKSAHANQSHNDSVAKFDDLGLYLFATEQEAVEFVAAQIGKPIKVTISKNTRTQSCNLSIEQAPKLFGISLRMTAHDVLKLFPGITKENSFVSGVKESESIGELKYGDLMFEPRKFTEDSDAAAVQRVALRFWNGRVYSIQSETDADLYGAVWKSVDTLIKTQGKKMSLPALPSWERVLGIPAKYCICNGFEVSFYAAPLRSGNGDQISIIDTKAEKQIYGR